MEEIVKLLDDNSEFAKNEVTRDKITRGKHQYALGLAKVGIY